MKIILEYGYSVVDRTIRQCGTGMLNGRGIPELTSDTIE